MENNEEQTMIDEDKFIGEALVNVHKQLDMICKVYEKMTGNDETKSKRLEMFERLASLGQSVFTRQEIWSIYLDIDEDYTINTNYFPKAWLSPSKTCKYFFIRLKDGSYQLCQAI